MCISCVDRIDSLNAFASSVIEPIRSEAVTRYAIWITDLGSPANLLMFSLVLVLLLWLHGKFRHMLQFLLALVTGSFAVVLTKLWVRLPRPDGGLIPAEGYSFASGHATVATIFFILIAYSYKSHIRSSVLRFCFVGLCFLAAMTVGLSRVYLGVHYASDVVAGILIGALISVISIILLERYDGKHPMLQSKA